MSIPKLRFNDDNKQEFPEWKEITLGETVTIRSGISPSSYDLSTFNTYPFLKVEDLNNCSKYQVKSREYSNSRKNIVPKNSIIFPKRGAAILNNKVRVVMSEVLMDSNLMALTPKNTRIYFEFLYYKLYKEQLFKIADTSSVPQINNKHILPYIVCLPSIQEQTKIANFLTAIDDKINLLTQKSDLLTQYKKGVMQQIFSQELRFNDDDGQEFPEWEVVEISEIADKVNKKNRELEVNEVLTNSATQGVVSQSDYFDREIANQKNLSGYYVVAVNDFVYNPRISVHALVGPIKRNNLKVGVMSPLYTVFRFKKGNLEYFEQYFQTTQWHDYMKSVSNSGARHDRMNITNESFLGMPIPYPVPKEQTKIADFLTAIDEKITNNQSQLNALKQYKQGLLQQLFV